MLDLLFYWNFGPHVVLHNNVIDVWNMGDVCLIAYCVLSVCFLSPKEAQVLKYWLKISLTILPLPFFQRGFFSPRNVCKAESITNRKDDTRTCCNYVQRYRFSPVFTCKTWAISFGIWKNPLLWLSCAIERVCLALACDHLLKGLGVI